MKIYCDNCGKDIGKYDDSYETKKEGTVCDDCMRWDYRRCMKCNGLIRLGEIIYNEAKDEYHCEDCISKHA